MEIHAGEKCCLGGMCLHEKIAIIRLQIQTLELTGSLALSARSMVHTRQARVRFPAIRAVGSNYYMH